MNDAYLSHDNREAIRRVTAAEALEASQVEDEMRAMVERQELLRDWMYADAMTSVARTRSRTDKDPSIWTPHGARTALHIATLLLANAEIVEDKSAFAPMSEDEIKAEIAKRTRTRAAFRTLGQIGREDEPARPQPE